LFAEVFPLRGNEWRRTAEEELLSGRRVADPALTSQTQSREGNHASVSLERLEKTGM
jgi:hypothetical protein